LTLFVLRSFQWTAADELNAIKTIKEKLETELAEVTQKYTSGTLLSFAFLAHHHRGVTDTVHAMVMDEREQG